MDFALKLRNQERDLIAACIRKERSAQKTLYETYYGKMMGVCLRYANNSEDARDILHEGFIKIFNNLHKYKPDNTSIGAWIHRIMVNTCIDYYRKSIRRRTENIEMVAERRSTEADAVSQYSEKEILQAVQQLSPAYRAVFNLYAIEGYQHKEIAEQLQITESTSRSNLVKARTKLKDILVRKYAYGQEL